MFSFVYNRIRKTATDYSQFLLGLPLNGKIEQGLIFVLFGAVLFYMTSGFLDGVSTVGVVRFWNYDDANLLTYYGHLYKALVLPPVDYLGYPYFYYYASGLMVIPMVLLLGPTPEAVGLGWRLMNFICFLGTLGLILFISRKYLKMGWVGFVACFVYCTTYISIVFLFSFRPMLMENLVNLITLVLCFELFRDFKLKSLIWLGVVMACGFSTKYHSVFLMPIVYVLTIIATWKPGMEEGDVKKQSRWALILSGVFATCLGIALIALLYLKSDAAAFESVFRSRPAGEGLSMKTLGVMAFYLSFVFAFSLAVLVFHVGVWFAAVRQAPVIPAGFKMVLAKIGRGHYYFFLFTLVFMAVVFLLNLQIVFYPHQTLDVFFGFNEYVS